MIPPIYHNPAPKILAVVLVSFGLTWLAVSYDASVLAKIDSMSAADFIQHQRTLHQHSFIFHFISYLVMTGIYVGLIEFLTSIFRRILPRDPLAE